MLKQSDSEEEDPDYNKLFGKGAMIPKGGPGHCHVEPPVKPPQKHTEGSADEEEQYEGLTPEEIRHSDLN